MKEADRVRDLKRVQLLARRGVQAVSTAISRLTKPIACGPLLATVTDLARNKPQLIAENLLLRQQLIVLNRSVKRPRFTPADRGLFILLASRLQTWKQALLVVKPETVLRWHREGLRLFWKRKSRAKSHEPKIAVETITLIKQMATTNRLWGAERIRGELLKVGIKVAKRTVQRYMRQVCTPKSGSQTWATFIRNHAQDIWACDFLPITDIFFRPLFAFVITELGSRRVVHVGVTRSPTDEWVAQQLREATPFSIKPKYLIRDNDAKYASHFHAVALPCGGAGQWDRSATNADSGTPGKCHLRTIARQHPARLPRPHHDYQRGSSAACPERIRGVFQRLATTSRHQPARSRG